MLASSISLAITPVVSYGKASSHVSSVVKGVQNRGKVYRGKRIKTVAMDTALKMSFIYNVLIR